MSDSAMKYSDNSPFLNFLPWWVRLFIHDCLAHPISGLLWILRLNRLAYWIHNKTVPMLCENCWERFDAEECPKCGVILT